MPDKRLYLLATFDEETSSAMMVLDSLMKAGGFHGSQTQGIPHHLTMASFDPSLENAVLANMLKVSAGTVRFTLPFHHIGLYGLKVLFLAPEVNEPLITLHRQLNMGQAEGENGWSAHATLLIDESEHILSALPIVAENFKGFVSTICSVSLYEFFPVRFIADFPLKEA